MKEETSKQELPPRHHDYTYRVSFHLLKSDAQIAARLYHNLYNLVLDELRTLQEEDGDALFYFRFLSEDLEGPSCASEELERFNGSMSIFTTCPLSSYTDIGRKLFVRIAEAKDRWKEAHSSILCGKEESYFVAK